MRNSGDTVSAGGLIGLSGNSRHQRDANGDRLTSGVHLHFEVRNPTNVSINPIEWYHWNHNLWNETNHRWDQDNGNNNNYPAFVSIENPNSLFVLRDGVFVLNTSYESEHYWSTNE